ncbi:hypothetical protein [Pseudooceanicola sp.]|uniref:hypothetical protein n=1 Tax=Pseudooceanicola sp. TaxID=1914328 RepID=UPI0035C770F9
MTDTVEEAWAVLCAPGQSDKDVAEACRTILEHCKDGRRATAQAMLDVIGVPS